MKCSYRCLSIVLSVLLIIGWPAIVRADDIATMLIEGGSADAATPVDKEIGTDYSSQNDKKISKRLNQLYRALEGFEAVKVVVNSGIVTLSGAVDSKDGEKKAVQLARQIEGVVDIVNELEIVYSLQKRLQNTFEKIYRQAGELVANLPLILIAIAILVIFWWAGGRVAQHQTLFRKVSANYFIARLLGNLAHIVAVILGLVLALTVLDATAVLGTIIGAAGILGLAISFAVRDTVENFIASILLSIRVPFEKHDVVEIDGQLGKVARLTSRATILISFDGNHIRIPNAAVYKAVIVNYSRQPERRFEFDIGIGIDESISQAQRLALQTLQSVVGVLSEPAPIVVVEALGDSTINIRVYAWMNQRQHDFLKVRSQAIEAVKTAYDDHNITIPDPSFKLFISHAQSSQKPADGSGSKSSPNRRIPAVSDVVDQDVTADRSVEKQIDEENKNKENLLNTRAATEL